MAGVMTVCQLLRLGSDFILVRLLSPHDFGLVALMGAMITLLDSFTQSGIEISIVRSRRGDDKDFLSTAWTLQLLRGVALWVAMLIVTWPLSVLYATPQLRVLLPVMSLSVVLNGATSTSLLYLNRHLSMKVPGLLFLGQHVVAVTVMLLVAFHRPTVWALIVGNLAGVAFFAAFSHVVVPGMPMRLRWERAAWDELLHFGKWIFAGNMVSSLTVQIDDLILGRLAPMASLGVYDVSAKYPFLARRASALFGKFLVLPLLSRHHEQEPDRFREKVKEIRGLFSLIGMAPILFLFFYAPLYFETFFPPAYRNAGWICQLLAVTVWLSHLKFSAEKVLLVLGDAKATAVANVYALVGSAAGLVTGFALAGMTGFALGLAWGPLLSYLYVQSRLAGRHGVSIVRQDLAYTGLGLGLALLGSVLPRLGLSHFDVRVRSVATFVSATIVLMVFLAVAGRLILARIPFRRAALR